MCDYSLESYKSRAAVDGEDLVIKRFASGSKGFVEKADSDCAVCCKDGVEMTLVLSGKFQTRAIGSGTRLGELLDHQDEEFDGEFPVTFHTLPKLPVSWGAMVISGYRDGFILPNGRFLSVQALEPGARATVTKALPKEIADAAKGTIAFDPDEKVTTSEPVLVD